MNASRKWVMNVLSEVTPRIISKAREGMSSGGSGSGTTVDDSKGYELYCFRKIGREGSPYLRIEYLEDNKNFQPAGMDFVNSKFNYGSWKNAFFIKGLKPVILNYDGTVDKELDPNDYTKTIDGEPSNNNSAALTGNVMIGFPTCWVKRQQIGMYEYTYISNKQIDSDYHAYAHTDANGDIIDYFYYPAYNGTIISDVMRSISGYAPTTNITAGQAMAAALKNDTDNKHIWNINVNSDRMLINDLLTLISKTSNSQEAFGYGNIQYDNNEARSLIKSGTMDTKGLFFGNNVADHVGVKVFGIENYWGNRWDLIAGLMYVNNLFKVKMTYGQQDGSTVDGYNTTGDGYIKIENSTISGSSGSYISRTYVNDYGCFPKTVSGSASTYDCDGAWFANGTMFALVGGSCYHGLLCGVGALVVDGAPSYSSWSIGASCSCKPLKNNIMST